MLITVNLTEKEMPLFVAPLFGKKFSTIKEVKYRLRAFSLLIKKYSRKSCKAVMCIEITK